MPSKFVVRHFLNGEYFHISNRGIDGKTIFQHEEDRNLFLYYCYIYLTPLEKVLRRYHTLPVRLFQKNLAKEVELIAYTFLPDHFHLILKQKNDQGISHFMKQLSNAYTQYFNQKYKRTGRLFEGPFKAVHIPTTDKVVQLSRYIHTEGVEKGVVKELENTWSSYRDYIDTSPYKHCHTRTILASFPSVYAYKKFVQDRKDALKKRGDMKPLILD